MRTMYVTRTKKMSLIVVKVIDESDNITVEKFEVALRTANDRTATREVSKILEKENEGRKVLRILSIESVVKRYRMEENEFLKYAEEIDPLKRDLNPYEGEE